MYIRNLVLFFLVDRMLFSACCMRINMSQSFRLHVVWMECRIDFSSKYGMWCGVFITCENWAIVSTVDCVDSVTIDHTAWWDCDWPWCECCDEQYLCRGVLRQHGTDGKPCQDNKMSFIRVHLGPAQLCKYCTMICISIQQFYLNIAINDAVKMLMILITMDNTIQHWAGIELDRVQ